VNDTGASADRVLLLNITKCLTKNSPPSSAASRCLIDVGVQSARSCNAAVRVAPHDPAADQSGRIGASRIGRLLRISDISLGAFGRAKNFVMPRSPDRRALPLDSQIYISRYPQVSNPTKPKPWVATQLKLRALRLEDDREALSQRADPR
jgi:hypothetical protein